MPYPQDHESNPKSIVPESAQSELSCLLQALTLRALHGLEEGGLSAKLDRIESAVVRAHRAEMAKLDEGTTVLGQQLEELASGMTDAGSAEQVQKLKALAAKLGAMGKVAPNTP